MLLGEYHFKYLLFKNLTTTYKEIIAQPEKVSRACS